jgi:hypothetical protein
MKVVARIAPEIDRLVFANGHAIAAADRQRIHAAAGEIGLQHLGPLPEFGEFLQGRGVTTEILERRKPYAADGEVREWTLSLHQMSLVSMADGRWHASDRLAPLLGLLDQAVDNASTALWGANNATVRKCSAAMAAIIEVASNDHLVAAEHRMISLPADEPAAMFRRLRTMRYLRQHDHVEAWQRAGLAPAQMVVLTELWHGGVVDESDAFTALMEHGYVRADQTLTDTGQELRDRIEAETNRLNAQDFAAVGNEGAIDLLASLVSLPPR